MSTPPISMRRLRQFLLVALVGAGPIVASAQLVPWSEPPALTASESAPPRRAPEKTRPAAARTKLPAVELPAIELPESSLDAPALFAALTAPASILLSSFDNTADSGAVRASTSWVGNVTQNATSITVAGTAGDDNGWGATHLALDTSGMNFLSITAQRDAGNLTPTLFLQFEDRFSRTKVLSVSTSLFAIGSPTTVQLPLTDWTIDFGAHDISVWSIGGGSIGTVAFRMTFDELSFVASAIPEPSTVALLSGLAALGVVAYRRRSSRL